MPALVHFSLPRNDSAADDCTKFGPPWPDLFRGPSAHGLRSVGTHVFWLPRHDSAAILSPMGGWVYIMTNRRNGTLYVGTTADLARRVWEHREGAADGFTRRYGLKRLVYAEEHNDILAAKQRELNIKHWPRAWKVRLIHQDNPDRNDLYDRLV